MLPYSDFAFRVHVPHESDLELLQRCVEILPDHVVNSADLLLDQRIRITHGEFDAQRILRSSCTSGICELYLQNQRAAENKMETMMAKKTKRGLKSASVLEYQSKNPNVSASEVVAALKQQGIKISQAMVYNIRSNSKQSKPGRRPATTSASDKGASEYGGKSQAVRAALRKLGRKAPTKEIIDHLAGKGVEVSVALVAKVKSRMKPGRKGRRANATIAAPAARVNGQITYDHLLAAKKLADELGGTDSLRRTLELLEMLR
jgi:hypothetical protein